MGRKIPLWQVLILLVIMILALMYDIMKMDGYIHGVMAIILAVACVIATLNGWKWKTLQTAMFAKIHDALEAIMIFITVGMLVATWISSGIVQTMIFYGLMILSPKIFLFAACILCGIVALATGSSWTTAGTVGVALIGIGVTLGLPIGWVGGAIISGCYFGDKMSPLSDTTNLAPAMAGSTLFEHIGHMVFTVTPSLIIALVLYLIMGFKAGGHAASTEDIQVLQQVLQDNFNINPLLLVAPLIVIVLAIKKVPALVGIFTGAMVGLIFVPIFQHGGFFECACYELYSGYVSETGNEFVDSLLTRGGIESMFYSTSLCIIALAFAGALDTTGMLASLCEKIVSFAKTTGLLIMVTNLTCIFVNAACADQYLGIVLPGAMYKEEFENRRLKAKNLSRCLEDSGTLSSPLIPWTTCSAYMTGALGIGPAVYAPFAFLNLLNPIVSIFYGFTGFTIEKMSDEEYEEVMKKRAEEQAKAAAANEPAETAAE